MDVSKLLEQLFARAAAAGAQGAFEIVTPEDGVFTVLVRETVDVVRGAMQCSDVTLRISAADIALIAKGARNVEQLFATGGIRLDGNLALAARLPEIVRLSYQPETVKSGVVAQNKRYLVPARYSEVVSASQPELHAIDARDLAALPISRFREEFVSRGVPLLIRNALSNWKLYRMTQREVLEYASSLQGVVRRGDYVSQAFSNARDFQSTNIGEFISSLENGAESGQLPPYMGNNILPERMLELIEWPPLFPREAYNSPRIWIGPSGTLTPLHRDATDNLFAQVWGAKRFWLAAPHYRKYLYTWTTNPMDGLDGSDVDPASIDLNKYPESRDATFHTFEIQGGEMLYIPEGWFHQVKSLSTSLSVNFWTNVRRRRASTESNML